MSRPVTVIGVDGGPLSELAKRRIAAATMVVGGARHLEALATPATAERVVLGEVAAGLDALEAHSGPAVVLASGDPGFFGVARLMRERAIDCETLPAVSSVATLCARAGASWDDALVISAHGRGAEGLQRAVNACRAVSKVVVLTAPGSGPAELGAALATSNRSFVVGERLGGESETVTRCCPAEAAERAWAEPNLVLVLGDETAGRGWAHPPRLSPASWALEEVAFEHRDGMVTKSEIRALALARLGPGVGDHIWDIGSGSGAVAIECARFGAAVSALDADTAQCARITRNANAFGVDVQVANGRAPDALAGLADPDAVFVGGGGVAVATIVEAAADRKPRSIVVALAALERVAPVTRALRSCRLRDGRRAAGSRPLGRSAGRCDPHGGAESGFRGLGRAVIGLVAATAAGRAGAEKLAQLRPDTRTYPIAELAQAWAECDSLVCFLAVGAVVRLVAPLLVDKKSDPSVVCVDESHRFAVAVLGGHRPGSGGNELAEDVADCIRWHRRPDDGDRLDRHHCAGPARLEMRGRRRCRHARPPGWRTRRAVVARELAATRPRRRSGGGVPHRRAGDPGHRPGRPDRAAAQRVAAPAEPASRRRSQPGRHGR